MTDFTQLSDAELQSLYRRVKDPFEAALGDEGITGKLAEIAKSIYQQESSGGRNTKTSNAGAVGGMQILKSTFKEVADKGWDINDPYDNARAGIRYLSKLFDKAGGDPQLTAAGYYGGPGGLEKAKQGIAVSDPRNPDAPDTLEYAKQVAARLSKDGAEPEKTGGKPSDVAGQTDYSKMSNEELLAAYNATKGGNKTTAEPEKEGRSFMGDLGRQVGLTARAGISGLASLPAMAADAVTGPINAGLDKVAGKGNGFRFQPAAQALSNVMTAAGLPVPENATERVVQDATGAMAGTGGTVALGSALAKGGGAVAKGVSDLLTAGPGLQTVSAATGAGAAGATREGGGGEAAQLAAGVAGSLLPSLALTAAQGAARRLMRGGEEGRQLAERNLAAFEAAGTTPTLGQATGGRTAQAIESMLSKTPGGAGVIAKKAQQQADEMASSVQRLSDDLAPNANATNAGEAIEKGVKLFKENTKSVQKKLYAKLDKNIPEGTPIAADNTLAALADLNADIAGAPALSKWFKNARIQGIEGGLKSDTGGIEAVLSRPGVRDQVTQMRSQLESEAARIAAANAERRQLGMTNLEAVPTPAEIQGKIESFLTQQIDSKLPYESIKKLRTLVGRELADNSLVADVPRSKWTALYSALSDDLGVAAKNAGPEAEKAWNRANKYTARIMGQLEELRPVVDRGTPEKIFSAATAGTAEGATTITRVINALPEKERREVAAAVLQRMGRATAGQQNGLGDAFSSETFLSNLSKFTPEAKTAIFGRTGLDGIEDRLGDFARVAESRREAGRVFANPSGTAPAMAQMGVGGGIAGGAATVAMGGGVAPLVGALAVPATAYGAAKAMTGPRAAAFAAERTQLNPGTQGAVMGAAGRALSDPGEVSAPVDYSQMSDADLMSAYEASMGSPPQRDIRLTPLTQRQGVESPTLPAMEAPPRIELNGMATPTPDDLVNGQDAPMPQSQGFVDPQGQPGIGDPRLIPMSQRQGFSPQQEQPAGRDPRLIPMSMRQQAAPSKPTVADIGRASTADDAIAAFSGSIESHAPIYRPAQEPAEPIALTPPPVDPVPVAPMPPEKSWYGRRGDGYRGFGDAAMALRTRQKAEPNYDWEVQRMQTGNFRLFGKVIDGAQQSSSEQQFAGAAPNESGTVNIPGDPNALMQRLAQYGVQAIPTRGGVLVGTNQAQKLMSVMT